MPTLSTDIPLDSTVAKMATLKPFQHIHPVRKSADTKDGSFFSHADILGNNIFCTVFHRILWTILYELFINLLLKII